MRDAVGNVGRARALGGAGCAVLLALASRALAPDSAVTKYGGDALYTMLLAALLLALAPRLRPLLAALLALALSCAVEFLQLADWVGELSSRSLLARLVLGSTFNAPDLFWYAVGAGLALGVAELLLWVGTRGRGVAGRV